MCSSINKETKKHDSMYKQYMRAYHKFYKKRLKIFGACGCPRLDSQFSESFASYYADFRLEHTNGFDGYDKQGKSCEVKGTGYTNTKVRFNSNVRPDRVFWVKTNKDKKEIYLFEIEVDFSQLDANGFFDLSKLDIIADPIKTLRY